MDNQDASVPFRNASKFVFVPGKGTPVPPNQSGSMPGEMSKRADVLKMRSNGLISFAGDAQPSAPSGSTVPPGWAQMHGNGCLAWIRRCADIELMRSMRGDEKREKVRAQLDSRIAELEATGG